MSRPDERITGETADVVKALLATLSGAFNKQSSLGVLAGAVLLAAALPSDTDGDGLDQALVDVVEKAHRDKPDWKGLRPDLRTLGRVARARVARKASWPVLHSVPSPSGTGLEID